jgi:hypothetical protein
MENQNSIEELHHMLGIVDQNIKNIKKKSNDVEFEDRKEIKVSLQPQQVRILGEQCN